MVRRDRDRETVEQVGRTQCGSSKWGADRWRGSEAVWLVEGAAPHSCVVDKIMETAYK